MSDGLLAPGQVLGETWEIVERLGRGGMGEVWLARHRRVEGKQAAIKVLRAVAHAEGTMARFKREAEIAARLEHPNIVQVFDFNLLPSGDPWLVMELLRGESLSARLKRGPIPLPELQAMVVQIGSALHAAHAAGVVHRDLKPANIFLVETPTGTQVKVLDFGISKLVGSDTLQTSDSIILGTPQYMSPEQATAEHDQVTGQSDLFSLATVCFEALSGHRPFAASSLVRVVYRITVEPLPVLRDHAPGLPEEIYAAIDHAMTRSMASRTPDIATFVREFCGVTLSTAGRPAPAPSVGEEPSLRTPQAARALSETVDQRPSSKSRTQPAPSRRGVVLVASLGTVLLGALAWSWVARSSNSPAVDPGGSLSNVAAPQRTAEVPNPTVAVPEPTVPAPSPTVASPPDAGAVAVEVPDAGRHVRAPEEKRIAPPRPADAPPTDEQRELLEQARQAAARADWNAVVDWSLKPLIAERTDAVSWRVLAWCHLGNLSLVNAYKGRLREPARAEVARACKATGIEL